jgi:PilZ domain-containing protein
MERRREPRHSLTCGVEPLAPCGENHEGKTPIPIRGTVVNISAGGACVLAERSVEPSSVLPCKFQFPAVPVPVPVLMQVRWIAPVALEESLFRVGLSFLA